MKHEFKKYNYTVRGIEIGNERGSFENCYISDKEMTEKEVLMKISPEYIERGYIVTSTTLDYIENVVIDLLTNEITVLDKEYK